MLRFSNKGLIFGDTAMTLLFLAVMVGVVVMLTIGNVNLAKEPENKAAFDTKEIEARAMVLELLSMPLATCESFNLNFAGWSYGDGFSYLVEQGFELHSTERTKTVFSNCEQCETLRVAVSDCVNEYFAKRNSGASLALVKDNIPLVIRRGKVPLYKVTGHFDMRLNRYADREGLLPFGKGELVVVAGE